MMRCKQIQTSAVVATIAFGLLAGGCGATLVGSDSTAGLLDLLASAGISEDTTVSALLDQVTVGDVVNGVAQFADYATAEVASAMPASLTEAELAEIEALQAQLEAGAITAQEFDSATRELIGDAGPPPGGQTLRGGPPGHPMGPGAPPPLDLTEEQQRAADQLSQTERDDVAALQAAANEELRALLTEEQLAIYDELPPLMLGPGDGPGPHGPGQPGADGAAPADRLAELLGLSEEQQSALSDIVASLQDAVQARREQARDEFLGLLTEEQLAQLEDWTGPAEPPPQPAASAP